MPKSYSTYNLTDLVDKYKTRSDAGNRYGDCAGEFSAKAAELTLTFKSWENKLVIEVNYNAGKARISQNFLEKVATFIEDLTDQGKLRETNYDSSKYTIEITGVDNIINALEKISERRFGNNRLQCSVAKTIVDTAEHELAMRRRDILSVPPLDDEEAVTSAASQNQPVITAVFGDVIKAIADVPSYLYSAADSALDSLVDRITAYSTEVVQSCPSYFPPENAFQPGTSVYENSSAFFNATSEQMTFDSAALLPVVSTPALQ